MIVRDFILLIILIQCKLIHSVSVSTKLSTDATFLHKAFPVPLSIRAIIEVDVSYLINSVRRQGIDPVKGIYTTEKHINIKNECTHIRCGQLANEHLHPRIRENDSNV